MAQKNVLCVCMCIYMCVHAYMHAQKISILLLTKAITHCQFIFFF